MKRVDPLTGTAWLVSLRCCMGEPMRQTQANSNAPRELAGHRTLTSMRMVSKNGSLATLSPSFSVPAASTAARPCVRSAICFRPSGPWYTAYIAEMLASSACRTTGIAGVHTLQTQWRQCFCRAQTAVKTVTPWHWLAHVQ